MHLKRRERSFRPKAVERLGDLWVVVGGGQGSIPFANIESPDAPLS